MIAIGTTNNKALAIRGGEYLLHHVKKAQLMTKRNWPTQTSIFKEPQAESREGISNDFQVPPLNFP